MYRTSSQQFLVQSNYWRGKQCAARASLAEFHKDQCLFQYCLIHLTTTVKAGIHWWNPPIASVKEVPPIPRRTRKSGILTSECTYTPENMPRHRFSYLCEIYGHRRRRVQIQTGKFIIRYYTTECVQYPWEKTSNFMLIISKIFLVSRVTKFRGH